LLISSILVEFEKKSIGLEDGGWKSWKGDRKENIGVKEATPNSTNLSPTQEDLRAFPEKCARHTLYGPNTSLASEL